MMMMIPRQQKGDSIEYACYCWWVSLVLGSKPCWVRAACKQVILICNSYTYCQEGFFCWIVKTRKQDERELCNNWDSNEIYFQNVIFLLLQFVCWLDWVRVRIWRMPKIKYANRKSGKWKIIIVRVRPKQRHGRGVEYRIVCLEFLAQSKSETFLMNHHRIWYFIIKQILFRVFLLKRRIQWYSIPCFTCTPHWHAYPLRWLDSFLSR